MPLSGETCGVSAYSDCANALTQMARMGWSYLNTDYNLSVIQGWKDGGCYDEITKRLGYRLDLKSMTIPATVSKSASFNLNMSIENTGFAPMINPRPVKVVLFNAAGSYSFNLNLDPRTIIPGVKTISAAINLATSSIPTGTYNVAIHMPDNAVGLQSKPGFSVQFANTGTWDSVKGWNVVKDGASNLVINVSN